MLSQRLKAAKGASGGGGATTLTYLDFDSRDNVNASSITFSGMAFGADDANRTVLIVVHAFDNSYSVPSSVTIGGVSATVLVSYEGGGSRAYASIWAAQPSGTSGAVVINGNGSIDSYGASTWSLITSNSTPTSVGFDRGSVSFTENYGAVSLFATQVVNGSNPNYTNATKTYGIDIRSNEWASAGVGDLVNTSGTVSISGYTDTAVFATWD